MIVGLHEIHGLGMMFSLVLNMYIVFVEFVLTGKECFRKEFHIFVYSFRF